MSLAARLSFTVDNEAKIIVVKLIGAIDGNDIAEQLVPKFKNAHDPWKYDFIVDHRAHEGLFTTEEMERTALSWNERCKGKDLGRVTAVVTTDPHIIARQPLTQAAMPQRTIVQFTDFDSALDFIMAQRVSVEEPSDA